MQGGLGGGVGPAKYESMVRARPGARAGTAPCPSRRRAASTFAAAEAVRAPQLAGTARLPSPPRLPPPAHSPTAQTNSARSAWRGMVANARAVGGAGQLNNSSVRTGVSLGAERIPKNRMPRGEVAGDFERKPEPQNRGPHWRRTEAGHGIWKAGRSGAGTPRPRPHPGRTRTLCAAYMSGRRKGTGAGTARRPGEHRARGYATWSGSRSGRCLPIWGRCDLD